MNASEAPMDLSIIMACYNSSKYINEALLSVRNQTFNGNIEIIIVDDCSTDNSSEIIREHLLHDKRILYHKLKEKSGPAVARNYGISIAKGEWIGILDSDDISLPERFEEQLKLATLDKSLVMIGSDFLTVNEIGLKIKENKLPAKHEKLIKKLYGNKAFPAHSSMIYRRDTLLKLCGYNKMYISAEDYDLWIRLSEYGKIASVRKILVKIRKHQNNLSNLDGGELQIKYAKAASLCHYVRINGFPDPSTYEEKKWKTYISWIDTKLKENGIYEMYKNWSKASALFFSSRNKYIGIANAINQLLSSNHLFAILYNKLFYSSLTKRLAREWERKIPYNSTES